MIRFLFNLFLVCAVAVAISMQDGVVHLQRGDTAVELDLQTALALLVLAFIWWWGIAKIWFFIKYGFSRRFERQQRRRTEEGLKSLTLAINMLAGGDMRAAQKHLKRARTMLGDAPLALWLEAELAQRRGNGKNANALYQQLAATAEGNVLGWRGILQHHRTSSDIIQLTHNALAVSTIARHDFAHELRIMAFARQQQWADALAALHDAQKAKAISKPRATILESVLHLKAAATADYDTAFNHLRTAHKLNPAMVPVALAYAAALAQKGDATLADKVITALWLITPHTDAAALFQRISRTDALSRLQAFEKFALKRKDHAATHIALAHLCLAANVTGMARTHAERAVAITSCRESYLALADVQIAEGAEPTAQRNAVTAPPLGLYTCDACGHTAAVWEAICPACSKIATLQWCENASVASIPESRLLI